MAKKFSLPFLFVGFHLFRILAWFHRIDFSSGYPLINWDYVLSYTRALRVHEFLNRSGRFWGYDPFEMSGYVSGLSHEMKNLSMSIFAHGLSSLVPIHQSLLALEIGGFVGCPFLVYFAARHFDFSWNEAWVAFGGGLLAFGLIDVFSSYTLVNSLFTYFVACYLSLFHVSLVWRYAAGGRPHFFLALLFLTPLLIFIHPISLIMFAPPALIILVLFRRQLTLVSLCHVAAISVASLALNWFWIRPTLAFINWQVGITALQSVGFMGFVSDLVPWGFDAERWIRAGLQMIGFMAAGVVLVKGRRQRDPRAILFGIVLGILFVLAYFGSDFQMFRSTLPRRFQFPFWLMVMFVSSRIMGVSGRFSRVVKMALVFTISLGIIYLSVLFCRSWNEDRFFRNTLWPQQKDVIDYLKRNGPLPGRLLFEVGDQPRFHFAELVTWETSQPLLSGVSPGFYFQSRFNLFAGTYYKNDTVPSRFSLFAGTYHKNDSFVADDPQIFNRSLRTISKKDFLGYMDLYNIGSVAVFTPVSQAYLGSLEREFKFERQVGDYRFYTRKAPLSWLAKGSGDVRMDYDKLTAENLSSGELILKFHWIKTFVASPAVPIKPVCLMDDPVPFIQLDNSAGNRKIVITNAGLNGWGS